MPAHCSYYGLFGDAVVADSSDINANTYRYDPWRQTIGTSGTTYNQFQFTGVDLDSATGLYRMTQRYYGPASDKFAQLDPMPRSILDVNRYAYAGVIRPMLLIQLAYTL